MRIYLNKLMHVESDRYNNMRGLTRRNQRVLCNIPIKPDKADLCHLLLLRQGASMASTRGMFCMDLPDK